ncbi:MAG: DUF4157 domain-containing protein [Cyanobacteria bacterium J06638_28]
MSDSSHSLTNTSTPASTFNPGHQLPDQPFQIKQQAQTDRQSASKSQLDRLRQLDAGVMQALGVQAKLAIGAPGDKYEQEADQVAAQVVEQINTPQTQQKSVQRQEIPEEEDDLQMKPLATSIQRQELPEEDDLQMKPLTTSIQRQELPEEKEDLQMKPLTTSIQRQELPEKEDDLQAKPLVNSIQRQELPEEEDDLQMKPLANSIQRQELPEEEELQMKPLANSIQRQELPEEEELQMEPLRQRRSDGGGVASTDVESAIESARGQGQSLGSEVRNSMEQAFGTDFSSVKVHTDSQSDQLNNSIQSRAFTTGQDIFFRQGEYQPGNPGGQELLAHELTHVVQQTKSIQPKLSSLIQRDDPPFGADLFPEFGGMTSTAPEGPPNGPHALSHGAPPDMGEHNWTFDVAASSMMLVPPEAPQDLSIALPEHPPDLPDNYIFWTEIPPNCGGHHTSPAPQLGPQPHIVDLLWADVRRRSHDAFKSDVQSLIGSWNATAPLIRDFYNAQDDEALQEVHEFQTGGDAGEGSLPDRASHQVVPRTNRGGNTVGSVFGEEGSTTADTTGLDDNIRQASRASDIEPALTRLSAWDDKIRASYDELASAVDTSSGARHDVEAAQFRVQQTEAEFRAIDAQADYDATQAKVTALKGKVGKALKIVEVVAGFIAAGPVGAAAAASSSDSEATPTPSAARRAAGGVSSVAASSRTTALAGRVIDYIYSADLARARTAIQEAKREYREAALSAANSELLAAVDRFNASLHEISAKSNGLKADIKDRRAAYTEFANLVARRGGGSSRDRNRMRALIAAIPIVEVVVNRAENVISTASVPEYSTDSGVGAYMLNYHGHVDEVSQFATAAGHMDAYSVIFQTHHQFWSERLASLRMVLQGLRGEPM